MLLKLALFAATINELASAQAENPILFLEVLVGRVSNPDFQSYAGREYRRDMFLKMPAVPRFTFILVLTVHTGKVHLLSDDEYSDEWNSTSDERINT